MKVVPGMTKFLTVVITLAHETHALGNAFTLCLYPKLHATAAFIIKRQTVCFIN